MENKYPNSEILGHRDFPNTKNMPNFDVKKWLKKVNLI